jgi:hypothetical protein
MSIKERLAEWYEARRWEFYTRVRPWVAIGAEMAKTSGWRMSHAEYCSLIDLLDGMNSYERKVLLPVLDDLAVCEFTESCMSQYRTLGELDVVVVYDEAVQRELAPLLVKRLREAAAEDARASDAFDERIAEAEKWHAKWKHAEQERDTACKQAATWEIQAQDLRDQLVQAKSELAALKAAEPTYPCFACGRPMETRLCWECAR